ncbi:hypothetical protein [Pararhizobium sp. PWRC1-1]|uniref:hypothetical protein n=1 Tax=Pararhizobium sp. PWRC1-1 TaxID=2804566 RepID=UPI003CFB8C37
MYDISSSHIIMLDAFWKSLKDDKKDRWMAYVSWWFYRQQVLNQPEFWSKMASHLTNQLPASDREGIIDQLNGIEGKVLLETTVAPDMPESLLQQLNLMFEPVPPVFDVEAARADAVSKIDRDAEAYRLRFITNGSGQVMAYQQKLSEAKAKLADDGIADTAIPHIVAEAAVDGVTLAEKAEQIVATFEGWQIVSASIERKRMGAKKAVAAAETAETITAAAAVNWEASE